MAFPALDAKAAGYNVFTVLDASGDPSPFASRITMARLAQAGVVPTSASAVLCEFQRHWNRPNNDAFAALYVQVAPNYGAVIESFRTAQEAAHKAQRCEDEEPPPWAQPREPATPDHRFVRGVV